MDQPYYGPIINNTSKPFSSRDCLGIESVSTSISAELCPIVNTVTPRAFYWPFMCWIYYDFYKNSGIKERDVDTFDKEFLKRQDYYFVLSNLLLKETEPWRQVDETNLVGKTKTAADVLSNTTGFFEFNKNYFITRYGGMQYYNAGCLTMHFITAEDEKGNAFKDLPRLTQYGERMAVAFERVICNTTYYKEYRLEHKPIPRDVLIEYGKVINIGLKGFDDCKRLLRYQLFERNQRLTKCANYARLIKKDSGRINLSLAEARYYLFDYYSPLGENHTFSDDLQQTIVGWEIAVGRQYLTAGIEAVWKYMLNTLREPMSCDEWIRDVLKGSKFSFSLDDELGAIVPECLYGFAAREQMVEDIRKNTDDPFMVEIGLKLSLSMYNRFYERKDLGDSTRFLEYGSGQIRRMGSLSFAEWFEIIDEYQNKTVREFLAYVMKNCIIEQHIRTCHDKLMRPSGSVYGFFFDTVNERFIKNEYRFQVDFQGIRFIQLMQVMQDLDMFDGDTAV